MHISSHILDLAISQPEFCQIVKKSGIRSLSSQITVSHMFLLVDRPIPAKKKIIYRKIKSIDHNAFNLHLSEAFNNKPELHTDKVSQYNQELTNALQKHAPEKSKFIRYSPTTMVH